LIKIIKIIMLFKPKFQKLNLDSIIIRDRTKICDDRLGRLDL